MVQFIVLQQLIRERTRTYTTSIPGMYGYIIYVYNIPDISATPRRKSSNSEVCPYCICMWHNLRRAKGSQRYHPQVTDLKFRIKNICTKRKEVETPSISLSICMFLWNKRTYFSLDFASNLFSQNVISLHCGWQICLCVSFRFQFNCSVWKRKENIAVRIESWT